MSQPSKLAVLETALAIVLWALSFVFIKIVLSAITPVSLITFRYAAGALILGGVAALRGELARLRPRDLPGMALLGAVGITLQQNLQVGGQVTATAGVAGFLASTAPAFLVLLAALALHEKPTKLQVAGVLLATLGAGIVASGGNFSQMLHSPIGSLGNLLILLSAIVWAAFTILNRKLMQDRPPVLTTAGMMAFGCLFTLPWFVVRQSWQEFAHLGLNIWGPLLYIAIFSTAMAYLLYSDALKRAPASHLAAIQNLEPLVVVSAAALILNEAVTGGLLLGGAAIVAGTTLAELNAPMEPARAGFSD
jgi:drug/metabolite transporter (DMT)-like permease